MSTERSEKVANAIIKNQMREKEYSTLWSKRVVIAMLVFLVFLILINVERSSQLWTITYLFGIPIEFMTTALLVYIPLGQKFRSEEITYLNGRPIKGSLIKKVVYYVFSFGPLYLCCVFRFNFNPIASIFLTPLVLLIVQVSAFVSPPSVYGRVSGPRLTPSEIQAVSVRLSHGGIRDGVVASIVSIPGVSYQTLMSMTPSDWSAVGHRVSQSGINIMKE